jgi:IclR family transcriptional regulator, pca regulon regulatory protein
MAPADSAEFDRKLLIEGLGKGLRVIEAFSDEHSRLTATQAGALAGLTRTAARRYLLSLVHFGYADTDEKFYWLTPRVLRLSESYLAGARLPRLTQPFLQRVSTQTGESANASVLDGHEIVYIGRSNSPRVVSIGFQAGARVPAHVVSPGLILLSNFDTADLDAWIAGHEFSRFSAHSVTDPAAFRESVVAARKLGYGALAQNIDLHLGGLAVALTDRKGKCVGALSITFQSQSYPKDSYVPKLLPALQEAAQALRSIV